MKKFLVATSALLAGAGMAAAQSGNLVIAANTSDAAQGGFQTAVAEFSAKLLTSMLNTTSPSTKHTRPQSVTSWLLIPVQLGLLVCW